ncbi:actin-like ATPase domain-containing protein [Microthyrium microscopicum]|uniref:Actin-like ATPase domain-containing protein n=1 Tax=Microthyrium microscopicum TaxID=703497 RepID=A0A6A6TWX8_9PEZI|nr:actin-like ATPase domain-containing protein [Microthyrium microscopicum]
MTSITPSDGRRITVNRSRPSAVSAHATSPHTPLSRSVSGSLYNSPTATAFRVDDENHLVIELGARSIRVGFAGESRPRCHLYYSPDQLRRIGDYRQYAPDYDARSRKRKRGEEHWARDGYELWRPDLRDTDLSFVGERLERLLREVEATYLMLDSRARKVSLVAGAQLPRPLLEVALAGLFGVLQTPTVTLFPASIMAVVGAGLRAALVVDIGWAETVVSAVYEYREVATGRTVRAGRALTWAMSKILDDDEELTVEDAEDILIRSGWCLSDSTPTGMEKEMVTIEIGEYSYEISRKELAEPIEQVFFAQDSKTGHSDDHDKSLAAVAYDVLLHLPLDVRKLCISRIIITGGPSSIPGLKSRLLQELNSFINAYGWNPVRNYGSVYRTASKPDTIPTQASTQITIPLEPTKITESTTKPSPELPVPAVPAHLAPQEPDFVRAKSASRVGPSPISGVVRGVHSLGAWTGASLLASLRTRGLAEIERDKFLAGGLTGLLNVKQPAGKQGVGERRSWSLAAWT